jgi:dTDP-4-dehydrorhamnose reductase
MNILLLGADGQVGWRLRRSLAGQGQVKALGRAGDGHLCGDLADAVGIARTVREVRPDVIVNAGAYTAVDRAEAEADAAFAINARACEVLATEAERLGAWLIHYSTDYVFDGSGDRPWKETDPPHPLNVYGQSKLAGEEAIAAACARHLIFRTSWVFDSRGQNFLKAILRAAGDRDALDIVADQWGAPTSAQLLAEVTASVLPQLEPRLAGLYHLAAAGETNRLGFAAHGLACARRSGLPVKAGPETLRPVATSAFPSPARRPLNSRLDTARLRDAFGLELPHWQAGVEAVVAEIASEGPPAKMPA